MIVDLLDAAMILNVAMGVGLGGIYASLMHITIVGMVKEPYGGLVVLVAAVLYGAIMLGCFEAVLTLAEWWAHP
jgi:hypothetical protein